MIKSTHTVLPLTERYKGKYLKVQFSEFSLKPVPLSFKNRLAKAMYNRALRKAHRRLLPTLNPPIRRGRNKQKTLARLSVLRHEIRNTDFSPYAEKYAAQRIHDLKQ